MIATKLTACVVASVLGVSLLAVPAVTSTVAAHEGFRGMRHSPLGQLIMGNIGRLMVLGSELDVTDEQRTKVRGVVKSHKAEIGVVAKSFVAKRRALRDAVQAGTTNENAIRKASEELGATVGDAAVLAAKIRGELRPIFTAEQLKKLDEHWKDRDTAVDKFLGKKFG